MELATVRLRAMVEVLGNWDAYVSDARYVDCRGATYLLDGDDVLLYVHAGVPGVFEKTCAFKALHPKPGVKKYNVTENWREPRSELVGLAKSNRLL